MLNGKRVLVTGAGGFIGSHLTERLAELGADVTAMVHYNALGDVGNLRFLKADLADRVTFAYGNIEDSDYVRSVVEGQDIVFHLAALIAIPYSYVAPRSYVRANVEGTMNVLEAGRQLGTARILHTSTSEVYGTAIHVPIDEEHPLQGQSPYSASKIGADKIAESYYRSFKTPVVTVRPFNTFGPRQSARAFIPTIISQALAREQVHLGSLDPERDMTFVSDTVEGFVAAATAEGIEGETINLGTGTAYSIGHFAERILKIIGADKQIKLDPARVRPRGSEVGRLISDNSKAARLMGWKPGVGVDEGLERAIAFVRDNLNLYRPQTYTV
ncbi:MAG: SDR family NAD(P)-dependent oxidoreductase [Rhodospirillaceae bacterium]|nr:SDR family NAD(P)-dependent oxidoreductase [Rhodospirillaceae bacterium]